MLPILWSGLNLILFLAFLYACFRVFKVLRREIGFGLSFLFLLGLVAFKAPNGEVEGMPAQNLLAGSKDKPTIGNWSAIQTVAMKGNTYNQMNILVEGQRSDSTFHATTLSTTVSGIVIGHTWKPVSGVINSNNGKPSYQVILLHDWKLMGVRLYTTSEEYAGTFVSN